MPSGEPEEPRSDAETFDDDESSYATDTPLDFEDEHEVFKAIQSFHKKLIANRVRKLGDRSKPFV